MNKTNNALLKNLNLYSIEEGNLTQNEIRLIIIINKPL